MLEESESFRKGLEDRHYALHLEDVQKRMRETRTAREAAEVVSQEADQVLREALSRAQGTGRDYGEARAREFEEEVEPKPDVGSETRTRGPEGVAERELKACMKECTENSEEKAESGPEGINEDPTRGSEGLAEWKLEVLEEDRAGSLEEQTEQKVKVAPEEGPEEADVPEIAVREVQEIQMKVLADEEILEKMGQQGPEVADEENCREPVTKVPEEVNEGMPEESEQNSEMVSGVNQEDVREVRKEIASEKDPKKLEQRGS